MIKRISIFLQFDIGHGKKGTNKLRGMCLDDSLVV